MKATVVLQKDHALKDGSYPLALRVEHFYRRIYIRLGYSCKENQWKGKLLSTVQDYQNINNSLKKAKVRADGIIADLNATGAVTLDAFKRIWNKKENITVWEFTEKIIKQMESVGSYNNAWQYKTARKQLVGKSDTFDHFTFAVLNTKKIELMKRELKPLTIANYFRTLRAVYNKARLEDVTTCYPFDKFKISQFSTRTQPRALSLEELRKLVKYTPKCEYSWEGFSRNYFLFSFYSMGMNLTDMARLTHENIKGDRIVYIRSKTHREYSVRITPELSHIMAYFARIKENGIYVLPILDRAPKGLKSQIIRIKTQTRKINYVLKDIAKEININPEITFYSARHTWATLMKRQGIPTAVISEGLGHTTEKTTQIYLDRFDHSTLDEANELLLNATLN